MCDCANKRERRRQSELDKGAQRKGASKTINDDNDDICDVADDCEKTSNGVQTETRESAICAAFSSVGELLDTAGPWMPCLGGSLCLIMLLSYISKNMDQIECLICKFNECQLEPCPTSAYFEPHLKFDVNKLRWPNM